MKYTRTKTCAIEETADGPLHSLSFIAHLGYLSGQHRTGLLWRAKNSPHASSSLSHVLNSETVKLLPGAFASYYRIPTFGVKRVN